MPKGSRAHVSVRSSVVEHDEGEHAAEPVQALSAPVLPGDEEHLGVGLRGERAAERLELDAQLPVVVDLAVEHEDVPAVGRRHRLVATRGEVDDRQAGLAEDHLAPRDLPPLQTDVVRPPVAQLTQCLLHGAGAARRTRVSDTSRRCHTCCPSMSSTRSTAGPLSQTDARRGTAGQPAGSAQVEGRRPYRASALRRPAVPRPRGR